MKTTVSLLTYKDKYYIKNIFNGCIIELNQENYEKVKMNNKMVISELANHNFFSNTTSKFFSLMIMLSNQCNLKCNYCFEKEKSTEILAESNISLLLEFIKFNINSKEYEYIDITYTGGEPLLNKKGLFYITNEIKTLCDSTGIKAYFSIITNGTIINKEILDFLNQNNFSIQVTLDGTKEQHNLIRHFENSHGTFDIINKNLLKIYSYSNIHLTIRINIGKPDFDSYIDLFLYLYNTFPNARIYFDFLDVEETSSFYLRDAEKIKFYENYLLLTKKFNRNDIMNYVEGGNCMIKNNCGITIDTNGDIYKCYSLVSNKNFKSTNIFSHPIMDIKKIKPLSQVCFQRKCLLMPLCEGGCPFKNYVKTGNLSTICRYDFISKINSIIFVNEVIDVPNCKDLRRISEYVEYKEINFKEM